MSIKIIEYTEAEKAAVEAFNERLRAGGLRTTFPAYPPPWLPKRPGRTVFTEYFLAADEKAAVRGGYILKRQDFRLGGRTVAIADFTLPISEGAVNRAYAPVGMRLLLDAQQRQPLLYALGIGSYEDPLTRLLLAAGWRAASVPFFYHVAHPRALLRNIVYLRRSVPRRLLLDTLGFSGLGWLAIRAVQLLRRGRVAVPAAVRAELAAEFADWADRLWDATKAHYKMSAVRDSPTLRVLYPREQPRFLRLKVTEGDRVLGWAVVLDTRCSGHNHFGNMRLGSLVDCLAAPEDAAVVAACAKKFLEQRGVDLIVSNQAHAAWCKALDACGFMRGPSNFLFLSSPALTAMLAQAGVGNDALHLNRGDGDGPNNL